MCNCLSSCSNSPDAGPDSGTSCDGGQPCTVTPGNLIVTVTDDEDNKPIPGINVTIRGPLSLDLVTDPSGIAAFNGITPGGYTASHTSTCVSSASASATVTSGQTTRVELRVRHTHAVLVIQELSFTANNVVEKDTKGPFVSPEWVDGRAQPDQFPVSYARNKKVSFTAKFRVTTAPCRPEAVDVKGNATFGPAALEWAGTVTVNPGATDVSVALASTQPLADAVGFFDSSDITWQMNPAKRGWAGAGTTRNTLYVTLADPSGSPNYWTPLDISCQAAAGANTEDDFVRRSFVPYTAHTGNGNGFHRKSDGIELTYYKFGGGTPSSGVFTCPDLLSRGDGTGRCGAWARFMVAMHQIHGVTSSSVIGVVPVNAPLLIVKNCTFTGLGSLAVPFTHVGNTECVKTAGVAGQGKNNPQFTFADHALVQHRTGIYDPSYGVGPAANLKLWEDGGIAGIGDRPLIPMTFDGDPHIMPSQCSPGFIVYTAVAGDSLGSIAANFGVASGNALYNHPYNAAFKAAHPAPATIAAGDTIIIPRAIAPRVAIMRIR